MNRRRIFALLLICALLLPLWAQGARVMGGDEQAEVPAGTELPAATAEAPAVSRLAGDAAEDPSADRGFEAGASLLDAGHTTASHAASDWTECTAAGTLTTGNYFLGGNVSGDIVIPANATVTLCLNGKTLTGSGTGSVVTVNAGATLNICDCTSGEAGVITGGLSSKRVTGGIQVNGGTLNLYGGTITGNKSTQTNGGGVRMAGGTFSMFGGAITGNEAPRGGGVSLAGTASFTMSGGSISENTATNMDGGVEVAENTSFTMSGGSITDNTAATSGGGLTVNGAVLLSGDPVVSGNTSGAGIADNINVPSGAAIELAAPLAAGASVGVTLKDEKNSFTKGSAVNSSDYAAFFTSDSGCTVVPDGNGQLRLKISITYVKPDGTQGDVPAVQYYEKGQDRVQIPLAAPCLTKPGYRQVGWATVADATQILASISANESKVLYPVFARGIVLGEGKSKDISLSYKASLGEGIDLSELLDFAAGVTDREAGFSFEVKDGGAFPFSLKFKDGKITGAPVGAPGAQATVTLVVTDDRAPIVNEMETVVLEEISSQPVYVKGELTLSLTVEGELTAAALDYTGPNDLFVNGTPKAATVGVKRNVSDLVGEITAVKYSTDPSGVGATTQPPTTAGTYYVFVDVAAGSGFGSASDLTSPDWTFTLTKRTPAAANFTFTPPSDLIGDGTDKVAAVAVAPGVNGMGSITAVKYAAGSGAAYTTQPPKQPGTYLVAIDVAEGDYYAAATELNVRSWSFTIRGAAATLNVPVLAAVDYAPGLRLGDVSLGDDRNWTWEDESVALTAGTKSHAAVYHIPAGNTDDWSEVPGYSSQGRVVRRTISLTVNPIAPTYTLPTGLTATEGQTLADVSLPTAANGRWVWVDPETTSVGDAGSNPFEVKFLPTDGVNYVEGSETVTIIVSEAQTPPPPPPPPEELTIRQQGLEGADTVKLSITGTLDPDAVIVAVKLTNGAMTDLAWGGVRNGNTVTFDGKDLTRETSDWKILFLGSNASLLPLCEAVELR